MEGEGRPHIIILTCETTWSLYYAKIPTGTVGKQRTQWGKSEAPGMAVAQIPLEKKKKGLK